MDQLAALLHSAVEHGSAFRASLGERPVRAASDAPDLRGPLPTHPTPAADVLAELVAAAGPGLTASAGPRYFGFVTGGALPAATTADVLAACWDQNAFTPVLSPAAVTAERVAAGWLLQLLGLPRTASVGFVTGGQEANTVGLAAARHRVLADVGWDVERDGLAGAPRVRVVVGAQAHVTITRATRVLGLGSTPERAAARPDGSIDVDDLERVLASAPAGPTIVCLQAGNVDTGACDDMRAAVAVARAHGAWVHVDGAFGLWAAAAPGRAHLVDGVAGADSWACDGHKWLNVPYDNGFAICADPVAHLAATGLAAPYLGSAPAEPVAANLTLGSSRRARGFAVWSAVREIGADGVAELVERCCGLAARFAAGLAAGGAEIGSEVVLNQVLAGFGSDTRTDAVIEAVQREGTCWMGGTTWAGRRWMRISVSNHLTTEADVDRSVAAVLACAAAS